VQSVKISVPDLIGNFNSIQLRGMYIILLILLVNMLVKLESGLTCLLLSLGNISQANREIFNLITTNGQKLVEEFRG
jgi:hypothetical protein